MYNNPFGDLPIGLPDGPEPETRHAHHLYTILVDEANTGIFRDAFLDAMSARNIGVGVHYLSIPGHPYYQKKFCWKPGDSPNATRIGRQTVSLPLSAILSKFDVDDVINPVGSKISGNVR